MVRSMMNLTTLPLSFWDYALESATRILNMVPTKKVDKTPYELWYGKVPNLSYLKVWGCEALVKRDTPDKLQQRSVKCIFIGYPKETMGYYFYFPPENKIVVARYAEFFEKNLITQEVSGRAIDLEEIQDEDTSPSEITSEIPMEVEGFEPPQEEVIPVRRKGIMREIRSPLKKVHLDGNGFRWYYWGGMRVQFTQSGRYNAKLIKEDHFKEYNARGNGFVAGGKCGARNRGGHKMDNASQEDQEQSSGTEEHVVVLLKGNSVDQRSMTLTMFMASLTSEDSIYVKRASYDSILFRIIQFEVQDHDAFVDHMDEYHDVHEMQNDVQHNYVVDSDADYTSDSNIIPYDQYVEDNEEHVVQCNASSVRNDALMSILDEMHEHGVQSRLTNKPDMLINDSVTSELARYKELVGEYEKRAKFELTDRERKIDEQMRIIISDRNRKETSLKSELHSAQILLSSTVDHYKSKTEEVKLLKKDFKQKEDKFLEEFLDLKKIKDKIEDRLYKQGQSAQTVHMLCQPKSFYDEKHKVAIGYKNPVCLARAKHAQSAVYNGHVPVTTNHTPTVIHDSEDTQNLLATFAPQRNLTPEQIFWSIDDNRKKAETLARKPISTLTVYPPNTPVKLVPRILPTKSQVKINLYVLTQLFTEFDKTCKTRITPSGLTEGERGFEQTKRCYLTEVIPFFKTLKEHFVGVQTALFKEVKVMEEIFDQMNDEVDQNAVDKQCAEIEKKNLLIENENLIVNCLSTQLLYDVAKSRCLDLEADVSKVHDESKLISKLEREYLNMQLKYQHLQESFDNKKSQASPDAPDFRSFFKIKNLEHQIQEKDNVIGHLKDIVTNVKARSREPYSAVDVTALIEQNNCDRLELEKVKQHYKELFDSIKILRTHTSEKTSTMMNEIESLKAQLRSKAPCFTSDYVKPKVLAPGMYAIDVKPIPHPLKNNRSAHLNYLGHLKESVETVREIVEEARELKPLDNSLNYACQFLVISGIVRICDWHLPKKFQ
ncbi:integrase, catalytic region, zinc finger, CCHC-type containing protein [Tanacetum coccineum]